LIDPHKFWAHYYGFIIKIILLVSSYQNTKCVSIAVLSAAAIIMPGDVLRDAGFLCDKPVVL
jgi:uncharacterized integral membrane protein